MTNTNTPPPLYTADPRRSQRTLILAKRLTFSLIALLLLGGGIRLGFNLQSAAALESRTNSGLQRSVLVTHGHEGAFQRNASLPASLRGNLETPILARSSGYVDAWYKTIGDQVKKGELLATIDAPEQDQELAQARALREQAKARLTLARQTAERWESLRQHDGVSQQELEEKRSALSQAQADVAAAEANVRRLEEVHNQRRITAPFAGIVVRRGVEVGNLVGTGSKELFVISQTDPLRLTVWVPQVFSTDIKPGKEVQVSLAEFPGKRFSATINHVAGGIDPLTRSRQLELSLPNPEGKLLPGAYAEISLPLSSSVKTLIVPSSVLIVGADGVRVAAVDQDKKVTFYPVKLGRDLGREVEILSGLATDATLIVSPSDLLMEGEVVKTTELLTTGGEKTPAAKVNGKPDSRAPDVPGKTNNKLSEKSASSGQS